MYMHIQGILLPKHTYIFFEVFLLYACISKVFSLPKHTYIYFAKFDYLLGLRLFILIPRIMRKLGVLN